MTPRLRVLLVRSIFESNIGASSRAMANMGAHDLILIAPDCEIGYPAQQAAATGQAALQNRRVYATWDDFLTQEPPGIRLALTARSGQGRDLRDLGETLQWLQKNTPAFADPNSSEIYLDLIFGPENWGLSNEDIEHAHYAVSIPTFGDNTSLNLAQAVLLTLFICRQNLPTAEKIGSTKSTESREELGRLDADLIEKWLEGLGFELRGRGHNVKQVMRRLLMHSVPTRHEVTTLNAVLQQSVRKMREYHQMRTLLGLDGAQGQEGRPLSDLLPSAEADRPVSPKPQD